MRVISATVSNFASYEHLDFNFTDRGLTLVAGPTGSGKSTLCDVIPWVLYGRTAKDGAVDEVRAWDSDEDTVGTVILRTNVEVTVVRTRGKTNDLFFYIDDIGPQRGKDLNDTQRLINSAIGLNYEAYLTSSYLHEFSQLSSFFTTTAKVRRQITEQLVDLSFAKNIVERSAAFKKDVKEEVAELKSRKALQENELANALKLKTSEAKRLQDWEGLQTALQQELNSKLVAFESDKQRSIDKIEQKLLAFEEDRARQVIEHAHAIKEMKSDIMSIDEIERQRAEVTKAKSDIGESSCPTCGAPKNHAQQMVLTKKSYELDNIEAKNKRLEIQIKTTQASHDRQVKAVNPYIEQRALEEAKVNTFAEQIAAAKNQKNPYTASLDKARDDWEVAKIQLAITLADLDHALGTIADVDVLSSILEDFRSALVKNTIVDLESKTNDMLMRHFDAEIRVAFEPDNADKLDVTIYKDGHQCSYTQLSKGQRQLLKLCFGVSAMRITTNRNQVAINCMFFDEVFDGCDDVLKSKAFNLLQELALEVESIFVVEHSSELKARFLRQIQVQLVNGHSVLNA